MGGRGWANIRVFRVFALSLTVLSLIAGSSGCRIAGRSASPPPARGAGSAVQFVDVTAAAGITFKHTNGASRHYYLPETMGAGCARRRDRFSPRFTGTRATAPSGT
jgi:hypothetical protein